MNVGTWRMLALAQVREQPARLLVTIFAIALGVALGTSVYLVNTAAQVVRMVDEVAHPSVKVHLDTFHMMIEENSLLDAIILAGPRLAHVHACENNRGAPGSGLVPWDQVAQGLKTIGYGGDLVIESFTPECLTIAAAAAIWRPLAPSQDALARDGCAFLRRLVSRM